jgi:two-component system, chemotaxis family, protein-glutamate methylesterase/glutaminase
VADIRVLIVDDSPTVCSILKKGLNRAAGIEVIGIAANPFEARDMIVKNPPDVLTLDIEMPRMDGLTFLRKLMKHFPLPVVVVSTLTTDGSDKAIEAMACGAVEVVEKNMDKDNASSLMLEIVRKVRAAAPARIRTRAFVSHLAENQPRVKPLPSIAGGSSHIVAIGSSTGGTVALADILSKMPADSPGTVIVQHMPPGFTLQLANRLDGLSAMNVREAVDGDLVETGVALIAPGDMHMLVKKAGSKYRVQLRSGPRVSRHKPSVDVLFKTVAQSAGSNAIGVILTGMGKDGAEGMLAMKNAGAHNIAQDEESCVVFGMPREAIDIGAASEVVSLEKIPRQICRSLETVSS